MGVVISIAIQKGGSGKTTTSFNLAANLKAKGKKVLLIDLDAQRNLSFASNCLTEDNTIYDVLTGDISIKKSIRQLEHYDFIPASENLDKAPYVFNEEGNIYLLKNALSSIKNDYDYIILDNPPSLGIVLINSLIASNTVIIPMEGSFFSVQGLTKLYDSIQQAKEYNSNLSILGILLIRYSERNILSRDVKTMLDNFSEQMQTRVFKTTIRESIVVKESVAKQMPLIKYSKNSKPCIDYKGFASEVIRLTREIDTNE